MNCLGWRRRKGAGSQPGQLSMQVPGHLLFHKICFLRGIALVYLTAFQVAYHQNPGLIGDNGLTPARDLFNAKSSLQRIHKEETYTFHTMVHRFSEMPSLLWFVQVRTPSTLQLVQ